MASPWTGWCKSQLTSKIEYCAVVKAHKGRGKILDIVVGWDRLASPLAESPFLVRQFSARHARNGHRLGMPHKPQGQVEDMNPNVDAGTAAAVFLENKPAADRRPSPAQHPATGVVDIAERSCVYLVLQRAGRALKANVLRGHQLLARGIARRDHLANILGRGSQRLFADHVLASRQRGNGQWGVIHVGRADVDNVDIWIAEQRLWICMQLGDSVFSAKALQRILANIAASDSTRPR